VNLKRRHGAIKNIAVFGTSLLICCVLLEVSLRFMHGLPAAPWKDYRQIFRELPTGQVRLIVQTLSPTGGNSLPGNGTYFYSSEIDLKAFGRKR